MMYCCSQ